MFSQMYITLFNQITLIFNNCRVLNAMIAKEMHTFEDFKRNLAVEQVRTSFGGVFQEQQLNNSNS